MVNLMHLSAISPLFASLILIIPISAPALCAPQISFPPNFAPHDTPTWCGLYSRCRSAFVANNPSGKAYRPEDPEFTSLVEAGWQHAPTFSAKPLLELRCWPRHKPVISGGVDRSKSTSQASGGHGSETTTLMIDARISHYIGSPIPDGNLRALKVAGGRESWSAAPNTVYVTVKTVNGDVLHEQVSVPLGTDEDPKMMEVKINVSNLTPRREEHELRCFGYFDDIGFEDVAESAVTIASSDLFYLPQNPYPNATTVILDHKTGDLEVWDLPEDTKLPKRFFPIGWYTSWSDYLVKDYEMILHEMVADGFTIGIHHVHS